MLRSYNYHDFEQAINIYENKIYNRNEKSYHVALYATLLILTKESKKAKSQFLRSIALLNNEKNNNKDAVYIKKYCQYYISTIEKNEEDNKILSSGRFVDANKRLKRWLRFPDGIESR